MSIYISLRYILWVRMRGYSACLYKGPSPSIHCFLDVVYVYTHNVHTHTSTHNIDESNVFKLLNLNKWKHFVSSKVKFWKIHVMNLFLQNETLRKHFSIVKIKNTIYPHWYHSERAQLLVRVMSTMRNSNSE